MPGEPPTYAEAVSGWAAHLRTGGTTPWPEWLARMPEPSTALGDPALHPLLDAPHLELVRRLTAVAEEPLGELADLVLAVPSPGRGRVDVPLPWPAGPHRFGSPAVDPAELPADDLVRLATGVLVHLLPGLPDPVADHRPDRLPWPWRRRFRLHGAPGTAAAVRHVLRDQGLVETDWRPLHVVLALPVEVMMAEQWATATRHGGILRWSTFWRRAVTADALPPHLDVAAVAQRLAGGRDPVRVVVARDPQQALATTARLLGARETAIGPTVDLVRSDLLRRTNRLAVLVHGPDRAPDLLTRLVRVLDEVPVPGAAPTAALPAVPQPAADWASEAAARTADVLRRADYPVHGDPADLTGSSPVQPASVDPDRTLDLAVAACLRVWRLQRGDQ